MILIMVTKLSQSSFISISSYYLQLFLHRNQGEKMLDIQRIILT